LVPRQQRLLWEMKKTGRLEGQVKTPSSQRRKWRREKPRVADKRGDKCPWHWLCHSLFCVIIFLFSLKIFIHRFHITMLVIGQSWVSHNLSYEMSSLCQPQCPPHDSFLSFFLGRGINLALSTQQATKIFNCSTNQSRWSYIGFNLRKTSDWFARLRTYPTRDKDLPAAEAVPYRLLEEMADLSFGDQQTQNMSGHWTPDPRLGKANKTIKIQQLKFPTLQLLSSIFKRL